jgi:hypothetical protein
MGFYKEMDLWCASCVMKDFRSETRLYYKKISCSVEFVMPNLPQRTTAEIGKDLYSDEGHGPVYVRYQVPRPYSAYRLKLKR